MSDETENDTQFEFDPGFQKKIVALTLRDPNFTKAVADIIEPQYFTEATDQALMRLVLDHIKTYKCAPDMHSMVSIIKDAAAKKLIRDDERKEIGKLLIEIYKSPGLIANPTYVQDHVVDFAKQQAMTQAIMAAVPALDKGDYSKIAQLMATALAVGAKGDFERYNYFEEIDNRTQIREDLVNGKVVTRGITSGYKDIDAHLYHYGWGRQELSCIMGPAKSGKSLSLGDFGKNAALAGYNVLYVSLEVSHFIIADRIDAALSSTLMSKLKSDHVAVQAAIKKLNTNSGLYEFQSRASGTFRNSDLRAMLDRYRTHHNIIFDLIIVDYADIMAPDRRSDKLQDDLRSIYIELRAVAYDYDAAVLTATQTNRDGAKASTAKATDIGDDWNKVRTVDILIGINATDAEKANNEARLYWAISRNTEDGFSLRIQQDRSRMQFITKVIGKEK